MLYWVIYDISDNQLRSKVVSKCKNYGFFRIQKSAFIGDLSKNKKEELLLEISELPKKTSDCIFIIPSCKHCFSDKEIIGNFDEEKLTKKDFLIIDDKDA